ncbi:mannose-1-phosphate guanylyltransferase [Altererythrobacter arenosus]|uniref:Mannose-1-phosphate guanylyltransferase n=1 Tax=Altererythrobacter arenosus TaxID=3032592 RepID=A0ABY8FTU7_9SPHN|nr:mannose-1-phosphate guanylyltransferase [Altererythrobacter sp. CAU 1644]WFL78257.1 mannose-1-phosphate guanylyltransferase [Altererythrobacter sp. CAU 1644]
MTGSLIHPVILCGGSGTRLWPRSRKARPKPFIPLIGDRTLFQAAIERCSGSEFADPIVVAGASHVDLIEAQSAGRPIRLIVEPCARNTAPAIALAAARLQPDDVMLVCPSDHYIADVAAFRDAARAAAALAHENWLVSFGITPDRPETGYGYIKRGKTVSGGYAVERFVEKPDRERALAFLESGDYSWNGGIFAFRAGQLLEEIATHRLAMSEAVAKATECGSQDGQRFLPDAECFAAIEGESIDYAVMENTSRAAMVPVAMGWSDIGNWAALQDALPSDEEANHNVGPAEIVGSRNVLTVSDGPRISVVGLEDVCIIVDGDEVLVTSRAGAQQVGKLGGPSDQ